MKAKEYPVYREEEKSSPYDDSVLLRKDTIYLDDGRPVLCELWQEYEYTFLSYYFSEKDLEELDKEEIIDYLESNGMKNLSDAESFTMDDISIEPRKNKGNIFWVLTISLDEE